MKTELILSVKILERWGRCATAGETTSPLGTQAYWDAIYARDISNYADHGDAGEIWFGEDAADKMVAWAAKHVVPETAVLDVGCGNGHLLFGLADEGFTKLHGVDYSEPAIELCRRLAEENERSDIEFSVLDLCTPDALPEDLLGKYGLIMDKGTFDAITLATGSPKPTDLYKDSVARLLKPDGLLLVTSCNWTQDELVKEFERSGWKYHAHVKYPTFRFGGVQGQTVCTVAFKFSLSS